MIANLNDARGGRQKLRDSVLAEQGGVCAHCGNVPQGIPHLDRIVPRVKGGTYQRDNVQVLCARCNTSKGSGDDTPERQVRFANSRLQQGFTVVPNVIAQNGSLSVHAKVTWVVLASYAWNGADCWPGQERLAAEAGMSERRLRSAVDELVELRLVRVNHRHGGRTNLYTLLEPFVFSGPPLVAPRATSSKPTGTTCRQLPAPRAAKEVRREEHEVKPPVVPQTLDKLVEQVWATWITSTGHHQAKLDTTRRRLIGSRLANYPVADVCDAVRGWERSDWHRGENPSRRKYNDLELLLRISTQTNNVEKFRDLWRGSDAPIDRTSVRDFLAR